MVNSDRKLKQAAIGDLIVGHITRYDIYASRLPQAEVTVQWYLILIVMHSVHDNQNKKWCRCNSNWKQMGLPLKLSKLDSQTFHYLYAI